MDIDEDAPREVWSYLVDCDGVRLTNEQHIVVLPGARGLAEALVDRTFEALDGMEDREPAALQLRFADGHVATGELPGGKWSRVQWEEEDGP